MNDCCYVCGAVEYKKRQGRVRDKSDLEIRECVSCGLVFLSSFEHISEAFYEDSGMHEGDVSPEQWLRETAWDDKRRFDFLTRMIENKDILDFGCGNGGFLIRCRDAAKNIMGVEPEQKLQSWFQQNHLRVIQNLKDVSEHFDLITAFHVLEHIPNPREILISLSNKLKSHGEIIIEVPSANDALISIYGNKAFSEFTYWSCHLFLFNENALRILSGQAKLKVNYIKQIQRYPLSNHLYWLAHGQPGGHKKWGFLDSTDLQASYEKQLASIGACDTIIASFSSIA